MECITGLCINLCLMQDLLYEGQKTPMVMHLLSAASPLLTAEDSTPLKKVILFAGRKQRVKDLARALQMKHIDARPMHSDLTQKERDEVMLDFRNGKVDVLVATDIVARGIDVDDIPLVINYDVPRDAEDYVHRIGRTARAENLGMVHLPAELGDAPLPYQPRNESRKKPKGKRKGKPRFFRGKRKGNKSSGQKT